MLVFKLYSYNCYLERRGKQLILLCLPLCLWRFQNEVASEVAFLLLFTVNKTCEGLALF